MCATRKRKEIAIDIAELADQIADCIGYRFKNIELMVEALTHKSYFNERQTAVAHNERLEFLGDAVLDLIISEYLMYIQPPYPEGMMTRFRAALVNEDQLANLAERLALGPLLLLGKGEEKNNGREKASILSDGVEAMVGAIFLDSDFATCKDVVMAWFEEIIGQVVAGQGMADTKTALQQRLQAASHAITYHTVGVDGPDHDRTYEVEVRSDGVPLARGVGKSKKEAEKQAAANSLELLEESS